MEVNFFYRTCPSEAPVVIYRACSSVLLWSRLILNFERDLKLKNVQNVIFYQFSQRSIDCLFAIAAIANGNSLRSNRLQNGWTCVVTASFICMSIGEAAVAAGSRSVT